MEAALLYITFARPEYARQSFDSIKRIKPQKLYFYSNKARSDRPEEVLNNNIIRNFISEIDWNCDLKTYFRDEYVDVYTSLLSAFDWAFKEEEKLITVEEDVILTPAFWSYCNSLLDKYKDDDRIWMISGENYASDFNPHNYDYHFSSYFLSHGWGTWKNRWDKICWDKLDVDDIIKHKVLEGFFHSKKEIKYHKHRLKKYNDFINTTKCWDFFFFYTGVINGAMAVLPAHHLIRNIGRDGMHSQSRIKNVAYQNISWIEDTYPVEKCSIYMVPDIELDKRIFTKCFYRNSRIYYRIFNKVLTLLSR